MTLPPSSQQVAQAAAALGYSIEIVEFAQSTRTAQEAADAVGCIVGRIVKSLLFSAAGQPIMCLVSGANQLDEKKLAHLLELPRKQVARADAEFTRASTGFAIGGVSPFGLAVAMPVYLDADLQQYETVWVAAGTPNTAFEMAVKDLINASRAQVADLRREGA